MSLMQADQASLNRRAHWEAEMRSQQAAGKFDEAIAAGNELLALERELIGKIHVDVTRTLESLEAFYRRTGSPSYSHHSEQATRLGLGNEPSPLLYS